jgi:ABC-type multidrug transport system permease subunit
MSAFLVLVKLHVRDVARKSSSLAFFFLLPLILLGVVGVVFAKGHPFELRRVVLVEPAGDPARSEIAERFARATEANPGVRLERARDEHAALGALRTRMAVAVATVGADRRVRLTVTPADRLFGRGLAQAIQEHEANRADRVAIDTQEIAVPRWGYVHYLLPGLVAFTVLLSGLFGMGTAMARWRQSLFLKKLATTPLSRPSFVLAQIVARALLVTVQLVVMIVAARVLFDVPIGLRALGWLLAIATLGVLTFTGVGFALACLIKTEAVLTDAISASTTPLVLFSEIFFPLDALPDALAKVCVLLPSTQMVRAMRAVLVSGTTDPAVLAEPVLVLLAWAVVSYAVALSLFRWHR